MLGRFKILLSLYRLAECDEELSEGGGVSSPIDGRERLLALNDSPERTESTSRLFANPPVAEGDTGTSKCSSRCSCSFRSSCPSSPKGESSSDEDRPSWVRRLDGESCEGFFLGRAGGGFESELVSIASGPKEPESPGIAGRSFRARLDL